MKYQRIYEGGTLSGYSCKLGTIEVNYHDITPSGNYRKDYRITKFGKTTVFETLKEAKSWMEFFTAPTWYCVTSSFDNRGRVTAAITSAVVAEKKPENTFKSTHTRDIYNDWFASAEAAADYMKQIKEAI